MSPISAYIPCFNNRATLERAFLSLRAQTVPVQEIIVVDDGSTDGSPELARRLGARVLVHPQNLGRGAARAWAMREAAHDYVLSCDATNVLPPDFLARAQSWMAAPGVAAVFGRLMEWGNASLSQRWKGRHLFKMSEPAVFSRTASLSTYGVLARQSLVLSVGNYNPACRHSEDGELGGRLLGRGYEVVFDPELKTLAVADNSLSQVLERYWRWHAGKDETVSWSGYLRQVSYSFKVLARKDLQERDPWCVPVSLFSPHYQFWRSWMRRRRAQTQSGSAAR